MEAVFGNNSGRRGTGPLPRPPDEGKIIPCERRGTVRVARQLGSPFGKS